MASEGKKPWVEYNWLSENCGLKVSNLCLGSMTFGKAVEWFQMPGNTDQDASFAILDRFVELGGNFVDTANMYSNGESEKIIGSWLSSRDRGSIVVGTKVFFPEESSAEGDAHPTKTGLSRGSIMYNVEQSLKRLQTDYIDIYYIHCYDKGVKLEETLRTFDDLVRAGKVRYIGLSNFTGSLVQKVMDYNRFMGFNPCAILQQEYNLASRESDIEVIPTCLREGINLIPYSPLKGGFLTGKFKRDDFQASGTLQAGTRLGWVAEKPAERDFGGIFNLDKIGKDENFWKMMDAIQAIGKEHGKSPSQVSIRWLLQKEFIPSVLVGAKNIQQLEENMKAGTGWKLTDEQMKQLDDLSSYASPVPAYPYKRIDSLNAIYRRDRFSSPLKF